MTCFARLIKNFGTQNWESYLLVPEGEDWDRKLED